MTTRNKKTEAPKTPKPTFEEMLAADPALAERIRKCPPSQEVERLRWKVGVRPEPKPARVESEAKAPGLQELAK